MIERSQTYDCKSAEFITLVATKTSDTKLISDFVSSLRDKGLKRIGYYHLSMLVVRFLSNAQVAQIIPMDSDLVANFIANLNEYLNCTLYEIKSKEFDFQLD